MKSNAAVLTYGPHRGGIRFWRPCISRNSSPNSSLFLNWSVAFATYNPRTGGIRKDALVFKQSCPKYVSFFEVECSVAVGQSQRKCHPQRQHSIIAILSRLHPIFGIEVFFSVKYNSRKTWSLQKQTRILRNPVPKRWVVRLWRKNPHESGRRKDALVPFAIQSRIRSIEFECCVCHVQLSQKLDPRRSPRILRNPIPNTSHFLNSSVALVTHKPLFCGIRKDALVLSATLNFKNRTYLIRSILRSCVLCLSRIAVTKVGSAKTP